MEEITSNQSKMTQNIGVRYGILLGVAGVIIYMGCYIIDFKLLFATWVGLINIVLIIAATIWAVYQQRKAQGGYIVYGNAVITSLAVIAVSSVITVAFTYILYNFIDADLATKGKEIVISNAENMMIKFGAPQSQIDAQLEALETQSFEQTPLSCIKALAITVAIGLVYSLILGIIMRKNRPIFA